MEVHEVQDILYIHILQLRHDGVFLVRGGESVHCHMLVAVAYLEVFYLQVVLAVGDVSRVHLPRLFSDMDYRWLDIYVGG